MKTVMIQSETVLKTSIMWDIKKIFVVLLSSLIVELFLTDAKMIKWRQNPIRSLFLVIISL